MLEGKVGEFSLPEIFQLIALTKKSGVLTVANTSRQGRVRFSDGEVCEAAADVRRLALGARLVAAGLVDEAQLVAALEAKRDRGGEVLGLLLEHAAIDEDALHAFVREHIADAVVDLLRLEDATFRFDTDESGAEPLIDLHIPTDQLVTEGSQRLAEWDTIRQQVPSSDAVLAVAPRPPDGGQVTLDPESWQLLALVDGRRRVRDIVDLCGRSEFATSKVLASLVGRGLVEVCEEGSDGPLSSLLARREVLSRLEDLELSEHPPNPPKPAPVTERDPEPAQEQPSEQPSEEPASDREPAHGGQPAEPVSPAGPVHDEAVDDAEPAQQAEPAHPSSEVPPAPAPSDYGPLASMDRAQVARELASLGLGDDAPTVTPPVEAPHDSATEEAADDDQAAAAQRLMRDEELNKGLLLRLIDGVKGA